MNQFFLAGTLRGGAYDHRSIWIDQLVQNAFQPLTLVLRQFARDPREVTAGRIDDITSRDRQVGSQAGTFGTNRILTHLHQHRLARLEDLLNLLVCSSYAEGFPIDLTGIQHRVASAANVDEGCLHAGQDVLDLTQVDIADHGRS